MTTTPDLAIGANQRLRRSLPRRLDFLARLALATEGTFELIQGADDFVAMLLPRRGAAITGRGATCSTATLALLDELAKIERRRRR